MSKTETELVVRKLIDAVHNFYIARQKWQDALKAAVDAGCTENEIGEAEKEGRR